jgi:hypothetical protein
LQENEHIGIADALPHVFDVGMFLRDVTAGIALRFKRGDERGLARAARADNPD